MSRRTTVLATGALLAIAACWGSTFFLIKDLLDRVPTLDFLAVRYGMLVGGAMVLGAMLVVELRPQRKPEGEVQHLAV